MPATCDLSEPLCHMTTWTWDYLNTNFANILKSCKFKSVVNEKVLIIWSLWTFFSGASRFGIFCTDCDTVLLLGARWLLFLWDVLNSSLSSEDLSALCAPLRPRAWKPQGRWNTQRHRGSGGGGHSSTETVYGTTQTASQTRPCQNTDSEYLSHHQRCVCVCAHADVCISTVREGVSSSQFLVVIFNQCCGGWMRKCLSGFVSCFRHTNHLFLPLFSSYLCERIRQKGREEINCILK